MSNEYKDWKRDQDEEFYSCAEAFARLVDKSHPELVSWFVKNFPTVWEEHNESSMEKD